jgi:hypothetical protein
MAGIKGTAIESLVADVNRVVQEGRIRPDELKACLPQGDLEILGQKVLAALWYPIGTYERLTQLLLRVEGRGEMQYVIERGRNAAARLRDSGIYGQLARNRNELGDRIGRIMVTLGPAMYQDTHWDFHYESSGNTAEFRIEVRVPPEFPDLARYAAQGFIEYLSNLDRDLPIGVSSERASPSLVVFRAAPSRSSHPQKGRR